MGKEEEWEVRHHHGMLLRPLGKVPDLKVTPKRPAPGRHPLRGTTVLGLASVLSPSIRDWSAIHRTDRRACALQATPWTCYKDTL